VPQPRPRPTPNAVAGARTPETRVAERAAINRLVDELVPALAAKLAATGLGEIEVREGDWRLRVRRPADPANLGRRATDRPSRAQPGHAGHGHAPAALEGHRAARPAVAAGHSTNGTNPAATPVPGSARKEPVEGGRRRKDSDPHRAIAKSPAVGVFQPKSGVRHGTRVRAGDRLGVVDMLGVPHDVLAPGDGVVGEALVEAGDAVEYGQELVAVELITPVSG
jgi:acetyl-CoA carboxylase biotin carboxyl carrier protein